MVSSIKISESTERRLLEIMARLQRERRRKLSCEDVILYLIGREHSTLEKRRSFADALFGTLDGTTARIDLREARFHER